MINPTEYDNSPLAIGGVGGSGTRLIADLVHELGYDLGSDLNSARDNLWFTVLFKHEDILQRSSEDFLTRYRVFQKATFGPTDWNASEFSLLESLSVGTKHLPSEFCLAKSKSIEFNRSFIGVDQNWGWKEPNTHVVLKELIRIEPNMRYIHVMRNGLDMAYSSNQNQLRMWGNHYIRTNEVTPHNSLKYWCEVHRRIISLSSQLSTRFLLVNFDRLCLNPDLEIRKIAKFLGKDVSHRELDNLKQKIITPSTLGRYQDFSLSQFSKLDLEYVRSMGFIF